MDGQEMNQSPATMRAGRANMQGVRSTRVFRHGVAIILALVHLAICVPVFSQQPETLMDAAFSGQSRLVETLIDQGAKSTRGIRTVSLP